MVEGLQEDRNMQTKYSGHQYGNGNYDASYLNGEASVREEGIEH
jgi:hypothetical protein